MSIDLAFDSLAEGGGFDTEQFGCSVWSIPTAFGMAEGSEKGSGSPRKSRL